MWHDYLDMLRLSLEKDPAVIDSVSLVLAVAIWVSRLDGDFDLNIGGLSTMAWKHVFHSGCSMSKLPADVQGEYVYRVVLFPKLSISWSC